jgi:proteasome accessory factor C
MARSVTAAERLRRVLAMVPWIVAHPGVEVGEVATRFGLSEAELLEDLNVVWMVGLPPYTPDALVDVAVEDGRVWIHYADFFSRPLRLTAGQGLALLASTDGLLSVPGTEPDGPLARALAKLATALGVEPDSAVEVDLGAAEPGHLEALRNAAAAGTEVEIDYYSYGRDQRTTRRIAPWRVAATGGAWYVEAYCHLADGERLFRIDRIEAVRETGEASRHRPDDSGPEVRVFHPRALDPVASLWLGPDAQWVTEVYPCEVIERNPDGSCRADLVVTARPWLERLLLRLGPQASLISVRQDGEHEPIPVDLAARAAARVLARYRQ